MSKQKIKPIFSIEVFKAKRWLNPIDYYLHLSQEAIKCGLISEKEFKQWTSTFLKFRLSPYATCQAFDRIIQKRWEERDSENYFIQSNRAESERNSFYNELLKVKDKPNATKR